MMDIRKAEKMDSIGVYMYEWESRFQNTSLNRGKELYVNKKVADLKITEMEYTAAVLTRDRYEVTVKMTPSGGLRMSCRCPMAKSGKNCEHMAAVMYAVEYEKMPKEQRKTEEHVLEMLKRQESEKAKQERLRQEAEKA